jgi:predicted nuclease with TOPRIM domain
MREGLAAGGLAIFLVLVVAGCGPDLRKENEQLKGQVASLQRENLTLKGEMTTLKADTEAMKKQLEGLTKEKQSLEDRLKEAEAKIAAKSAIKPPLKPKRGS